MSRWPGVLAVVLTVLLASLAIVACDMDGSERPVSPPATVTATMTTTTTVPATPSHTPIPAQATPAPRDESDLLFDTRVVHIIAIDVAQSDLTRLVPGGDERVRARVAVDGTAVADVGLRLKGGAAQARPLSEKAGFSVDTDAFVRGRTLFGVTRFTLGNAVNDPSFIAETITYRVFRQAGAYAPRTALATVSVNGERFGLYVMREGYDKGYLRRAFADPEGNLYEAAVGVDISDSARMELRTNESKGDRSDLEALAAVVAGAPDDQYLAALGAHVDLDQLLTYWAIEAITCHWDGYAVPSQWSPNNYYVYHDPARGRFVFLAHGADWTLYGDPNAARADPDFPVLVPPSPAARMADRLYASAAFRQRLQARILEVIERHWDTEALLADADELAALVRTTRLDAPREEVSLTSFEQWHAEKRAFIAGRATAVRGQLR